MMRGERDRGGLFKTSCLFMSTRGVYKCMSCRFLFHRKTLSKSHWMVLRLEISWRASKGIRKFSTRCNNGAVSWRRISTAEKEFGDKVRRARLFIFTALKRSFGFEFIPCITHNHMEMILDGKSSFLTTTAELGNIVWMDGRRQLHVCDTQNTAIVGESNFFYEPRTSQLNRTEKWPTSEGGFQ